VPRSSGTRAPRDAHAICFAYLFSADGCSLGEIDRSGVFAEAPADVRTCWQGGLRLANLRPM
jgi:hypothetical protein